jgi:DNA-binding transcriptional ArsR family regulator
VQSLQSLSDTFAALGDATRLAIVSRLASEGEMTVQEIARPFAMSLPAVSQHLKVLEHAGLIARGRDGQKRPCRLDAERLAETARWFDHTQAAWEARLDRLERFLAEPQSPQPSSSQPTISKGEDNEP